VSLLIGGVGLLLPTAAYFMETWPAMSVYLWLVILFLLVWILAMGIIDGVSTYFYYLRVRDDLIVHKTVLEAKRKILLEEKEKEEEVEQADYEQKYKATLDQLKNDPNNAELRLELLRLGRWLKEKMKDKYCEQSLANDLAAVTGNSQGQPVDKAAQVEKLGQLFLKGIITSEEFERGKALFLGSAPDVAKKTMDTLDDLYRLQQKGVLSEGEYNMKKWDLLAGKSIR